jgi:putative transposase
MGKKKRMPTLWEIPDKMWERIEAIIDEFDPRKETGRPREDRRRILDALIFRIRTGCQWNHIPRVYGDDSTIHRTFQHWQQIGLIERIWAMIVEECDDLGKVDWQWQSADTVLGKARMGGDEIGPNPTDRAKNGTKRSMLVDAGGGPLAVVIAPANVVDAKLLDKTIEAIVVERPEPTKLEPQHICLDKGYDNPKGEEAVVKHNYQGHISRIREDSSHMQAKKSIPLAVGS